jgi:hypothetical protein
MHALLYDLDLLKIPFLLSLQQTQHNQTFLTSKAR